VNSTVNKNLILLIQLNESSYNSLNYLQNLLGEEFEKLGFDVEKIEINNPQFKEKLISFLKSGQIYFAMGFSGIGSEILFNNELVWDVFKTPFFNWCCDHPCYYPARHKISNQWLLHNSLELVYKKMIVHLWFMIQLLEPIKIAPFLEMKI
jgi:hypothetical protein